MGGASGHMKHPYEMSSEEMTKFFNEFISKKLDATEKVDGINLFVGYQAGKLVIARTPKEDYTTPREKFRASMGSISSFQAGYRAIKKKLDSLSWDEKVHYKLIDENGNTQNFINLEIIKGLKPNIIKYSKDKNYIVFHAFVGSKETNWESDVVDQKSLLTSLAEKLGSVKTETKIAKYSGEGSNIERYFEAEPRTWYFVGPIDAKINITTKTINAWNEMVVNEDNKKEMCLKIGSLILQDLKSELTDPDVEQEIGYPGVEGLAVPYLGELVKITGDFAVINLSIEHSNNNFVSPISEYIMKSIFGLKVKTMPKNKMDDGVAAFLTERNPKINLQREITAQEKEEIDRLGKEAISGLMELKKGAHDWVIDSSNSQIVDIKNLLESEPKTINDLANSLFINIFWQ